MLQIPLSTLSACSQAYHLWLHLLSTIPASWRPWSHLFTSPHTSEGIFWVLQLSYQPRLVSFTELQCAFPKLPGIAGFKRLFHQHTDIELSHITTFVDNLWIRITTILPSLMNIYNWRTDLPTLHTLIRKQPSLTNSKNRNKILLDRGRLQFRHNERSLHAYIISQTHKHHERPR